LPTGASTRAGVAGTVGDVRDGEIRESLQALLDRQGRLHQPARAGEERHPVELALGVAPSHYERGKPDRR